MALVIAIASFSLLLYTYVGYPIIISVLAWLRPAHALARAAYLPTVSVCISVYNGEEYLAKKLKSVFAQTYPKDKMEVLVFLDGADKGSLMLMRGLRLKYEHLLVFTSEQRHGKPSALNHLSREAHGEVLILTDVRQALAPEAISRLVEPLADRNVGCVSGNLELDGNAGAGFYWRYEKWIRRHEARFRSLVGVTGALYSVRKEDFPILPQDIILDDLFVPMKLRMSGKKVICCEEARVFDVAEGDEREFARKVRTLAGNFQLFARMPELLHPMRNPSWLETVSHKALRLACPWALLSLFAASFALSRALTVIEGGFLTLALLGPRAGRLAALSRTFVVLNAAVVLGLWRHIRDTQKVTW